MINDKRIKFFFLIICVLQLFYIFHFRSGFEYEVLKNPFSRDSGVNYALPPEVIEVRDIMIKHKMIDFNLSVNLKKNTYLYQRIIEFNYPLRINENSEFIFLLKDEDIPNSCKLIEHGIYSKIVRCKK